MARDVTLLVARARDGTIAVHGQVPWKISADLRRFKRMTMGTPMIMGRKTFDSFPQALHGRRHIVLTRNPEWRAAGAEVAHSVEEALALAGEGDISVIGGAEIFAWFEPYATRFELTEVHEDTHGDTFMPPPEPHWQEVAREEFPAADGWPAYAFVTLERTGK